MTPEQQQQLARKPEPKLLPSESRAYREQGSSVPACKRCSTSGRRGRTRDEEREQTRHGAVGKNGKGTRDHGRPHGAHNVCDPEARASAEHAPGEPWSTSTRGGQRRCLATVSENLSYARPGAMRTSRPQIRSAFRQNGRPQEAGYGPSKGPRMGRSGVAARARNARCSDPPGCTAGGRGRGRRARGLNVRLHDEERERDRGMSW